MFLCKRKLKRFCVGKSMNIGNEGMFCCERLYWVNEQHLRKKSNSLKLKMSGLHPFNEKFQKINWMFSVSCFEEIYLKPEKVKSICSELIFNQNLSSNANCDGKSLSPLLQFHNRKIQRIVSNTTNRKNYPIPKQKRKS